MGEEVKRALQVNLTLNWPFLPVSDGGTAWITQESFDRDETDSGAGLKWKNVARQLKEDLSSIILLSEEELQVLTDVLCLELAQKLGQSHAAGKW